MGLIHTDLVQVVIKSDDDGHEYVIPAQKEPIFDKLLAIGDLDAFEDFNKEFEAYRAGGSIDIPLFAKVGYEADL